MSAHILPELSARGLHYATAPHSLLSSRAYSTTARLVLTWMLDRPIGWTFRVGHIQSELGLTKTAWARVRAELERAGIVMLEKFGLDWRLDFDRIKLLDSLVSEPVSINPVSRQKPVVPAAGPVGINSPLPAPTIAPVFLSESYTSPDRLVCDRREPAHYQDQLNQKSSNTPVGVNPSGSAPSAGECENPRFVEITPALAARLAGDRQQRYVGKVIASVRDAKSGNPLDDQGIADLCALLADPGTLDPVALLKSIVRTGFRRGTLADLAHPGETWADAKARVTGKPAPAASPAPAPINPVPAPAPAPAPAVAASVAPAPAPEAPEAAAPAAQAAQTDPQASPQASDPKRIIREHLPDYVAWLEHPRNVNIAIVTKMLIKSAGSVEAALDVHSPASLLAEEFAAWKRNSRPNPDSHSSAPDSPPDREISFRELIDLARKKEAERAAATAAAPASASTRRPAGLAGLLAAARSGSRSDSAPDGSDSPGPLPNRPGIDMQEI